MEYDDLPRAELVRRIKLLDPEGVDAGKEGIVLNYSGRTAPWQIIRQVKPKLTSIKRPLSVGEESAQSENVVMDAENLSGMVTLYKYRGQIDLILADPPYNTGEDFRYNDKWDKDPNDPDLGDLVPKDDGSKHSKWLKFMVPRLWMMKEMLKPSGVIAVCIDHRELFRLGMMMDEIFHEENRIGIINWQKSYSPRSDNQGVSTATEYVLVYAKDGDRAKTGLTQRTDEMNARYWNPDKDKEGDWKKNGDASAPNAATHRKMLYGIQHPFTGEIEYPPSGRCWASEKKSMKQWLEEWGSEYHELWIDDDNVIEGKDGESQRVKALVIKGCKFRSGKPVDSDKLLLQARARAQKRLNAGKWPELHFGVKGETRPQLKRYLKEVKQGKVPMTYWADEDYEQPLVIGTQSWDHEQSGHSQTGINELDAVVGAGHNFKTVKPLKLFKKIIQIWCKSDGVVLDPFAGSGTTGHAVLELNKETDSRRRFVLIEQGNNEKGDHYAKTLTADRVKRVITGDWAEKKHRAVAGGFRFIEMKREKIDADAVNALAREEMIDLLLTSHWDKAERAKAYLQRFPAGEHHYLFGVNAKREGFFLIWDAPDQPSKLDQAAFTLIVDEARRNFLVQRYHVYASFALYSGRSVEFYKIPDKVLEHIGFNMRADAFNNETVQESAHV